MQAAAALEEDVGGEEEEEGGEGEEGEVKEQAAKTLKTHAAARNDFRALLKEVWPGYHRVS